MARNVKLLLVENVDSIGIVGDVVNVRTGFARNFLLPRNLATQPDDKLIAKLAGKRADAQKMLAEKRKEREALSQRLQGVAITLIRSCNDAGVLYASITQQDVATELNKAGFGVTPRDVRIAQTIKRVDSFELHIKLDSDLDAIVKLKIEADRKIDHDKPEEKPKGEKGDKKDGDAEAVAAEGDATDAKGEKTEAGDKPAKSDHAKGDRPARGDRKPRSDRKDGESSGPKPSSMGSYTEDRKIVKWSTGSKSSAPAAEPKTGAEKAAAAAAKKAKK